MKYAPDSFATAFAIRVLPVPGAPWSKTPFGGSIPSLSKTSGLLRGTSIISLILGIISPNPPISS